MVCAHVESLLQDLHVLHPQPAAGGALVQQHHVQVAVVPLAAALALVAVVGGVVMGVGVGRVQLRGRRPCGSRLGGRGLVGCGRGRAGGGRQDGEGAGAGLAERRA